MGAGISSPPVNAPISAATEAVCEAIERVMCTQVEYARSLHDFAIARMEADASAATVNSSASAAARSKMAVARSQALNNALKERLTADFLAPTAALNKQLREEIARGGTTVGLTDPRNVVPMHSPQAGAAAALAPSPTSPKSPTSASRMNSAAFAALSPSEQDRAIRGGVDAQVKRVWAELELQSHYDLMGKPLNFEQREEAVHKELQDTWNNLEF